MTTPAHKDLTPKEKLQLSGQTESAISGSDPDSINRNLIIQRYHREENAERKKTGKPPIDLDDIKIEIAIAAREENKTPAEYLDEIRRIELEAKSGENLG